MKTQDSGKPIVVRTTASELKRICKRGGWIGKVEFPASDRRMWVRAEIADPVQCFIAVALAADDVCLTGMMVDDAVILVSREFNDLVRWLRHITTENASKTRGIGGKQNSATEERQTAAVRRLAELNIVSIEGSLEDDVSDDQHATVAQKSATMRWIVDSEGSTGVFRDEMPTQGDVNNVIRVSEMEHEMLIARAIEWALERPLTQMRIDEPTVGFGGERKVES